MTGLSGSGKSTLAIALDQKLNNLSMRSYILDGDNLRDGICSDLDFSLKDRSENLRRAAEISKLFVDAGIIVIVGLISPLYKDRAFAKSLFADDRFFEIYLSTSLENCEKRDVKGLYKKVRDGEIKNFTGIDSPYDIPKNPNLIIDTSVYNVDDCVDMIVNKINYALKIK